MSIPGAGSIRPLATSHALRWTNPMRSAGVVRALYSSESFSAVAAARSSMAASPWGSATCGQTTSSARSRGSPVCSAAIRRASSSSSSGGLGAGGRTGTASAPVATWRAIASRASLLLPRRSAISPASWFE
jgi:hypothetical protein